MNGEPKMLTFTADGPMHVNAVASIDGQPSHTATAVTVEYRKGYALVRVEHSDGTVETYEASNASIDVTAWLIEQDQQAA